MSKQEMLSKIEALIFMETMAMPIYTKHVRASLFWSGLKNKTQKEIEQKLEYIQQASYHQGKMLLELQRMIKFQSL